MDEETKGRLGVAMSALDVSMDEVETVKKYMALLGDMTDIQAQADMREIISDELNHIERFMNVFVEASGIAPAEE